MEHEFKDSIFKEIDLPKEGKNKWYVLIGYLRIIPILVILFTFPKSILTFPYKYESGAYFLGGLLGFSLIFILLFKTIKYQMKQLKNEITFGNFILLKNDNQLISIIVFIILTLILIFSFINLKVNNRFNEIMTIPYLVIVSSFIITTIFDIKYYIKKSKLIS